MAQPHTLVHQLADHAQRRPDDPAIHGKRDGAWVDITWSGYWEAVREVGRGLLALGHQVGECVAIVGANRPEWVISQFGIMAIRGVPAPIYTTNTDEQRSYIVRHSQAKIAFCDDADALAQFQRCITEGRMEVDKIVVMDDVASDDPKVITLSALRALGREHDEAELDARLDALTADETALLIYTSGTTGVPKAVMLEHGGMMHIAAALLERMPPLQEPGNYKVVSYLPLCHVAEQLFTNFLSLSAGGEVWFCDDLRKIKDALTDVRPTVFLGVPRVWEKFQAALEARLAEATGLKASLTAWARKTELAAAKKQMETGQNQAGFARSLANKLVISKVKTALGLDRLLTAATGAAPISLGTLEFFASLGILIHEGYGMSETTGVSHSPTYLRPKFGTVGQAVRGVETRIAPDGEILLKGRIMTRGYLHMPEQTAELLDDEGWLHTGDLGSVDADGYLKITGRKKDILITAGGKNVAPAEMEGHLNQIVGVAQAVVVGDRQPYLAALLTLDVEALPELRTRLGLGEGELADIVQSDALRHYLEERIEAECNAKVARYQTIKRFEVLPVEFSVDGGELTPTQKLKRNVVAEKYAAEIAALFTGAEGAKTAEKAAQPPS